MADTAAAAVAAAVIISVPADTPRLVKDARVLCGLDDPVDERPALQDLDVLARDRDGAASRGNDGHDTRHDVAVEDG